MLTSDRNPQEQQLEQALRAIGGESEDSVLHPPVDDLTRRRVTDAVLTAHACRTPNRTEHRPWVRISVAAMATVTGALTLLFFVYSFRENETHHAYPLAQRPSATVALPAYIPRSRIALLHGKVHCTPVELSLNGSVPMDAWIETGQGHSAFALPTGIAVGLSHDTAVRVQWDGRRGYGVEMAAGMALFSVDPQRDRDEFFVQTPEGAIRVAGTLFTVTVRDEGPVSVYLHNGVVTLETGHAETLVVPEGHMGVMWNRTARLEPATKNPTEVTRQIQRLGCMDDGSLFSEVDPSICTPGSTESQTRESTARRRVSPESAVRPSETIAGLLEQARNERMAGRHADAATVLSKLVSTWPDSPDARTARVTLGQLQLKNLNRPADARRHFSLYLQHPGPLTQDALVGLADACRKLADTSCERTALTRLLREFSGSPAEAAARRRLQDMSRMTPEDRL